jgi:hypothetical protein
VFQHKICGVSGFNQHPWIFWVITTLAIIACVGGIGAVVVFCLGLLLTWRSHWIAALKARRGFEVKLNPGTTPGLLEKKED